jgi:hypothetical protein
MTKGAIWGSYYMYRSHQEKAFYKELNAAKKGVGTNFYLDGNLSKHYEEYRELRMNYITEFGQAAFQFAKIHQMALTHTGGNVTQAHAVIKTTFQKARAVSTDVGQDQMTQILVSVTF